MKNEKKQNKKNFKTIFLVQQKKKKQVNCAKK